MEQNGNSALEDRLVMKRLLGERGFTLVELLVTVAVISVLTAMGAPRIHAAFIRNQEAQVQQDLNAIHSALERHYLDLSFYPMQLNDLVKRHYMKPSSFQSPVSGHWYFYVVDDNREDGLAQAYALGAPPKNAYKEEYRTIYRGLRAIPEGRNPKLKARAWLRWEVTPGNLNWLMIFLKYENDATTIENPADLPTSLATYRRSCNSASSAGCDLFTN